MKFKKVIALILFLALVIPRSAIAADTFLDNDALNNFENSNNILISEFNSGKIIAKKQDTNTVSYKKLANQLAIFYLSENLKNSKLTLESNINLIGSDEITTKYKLEQNVTVKDAIFLIENTDSNVILNSIFTAVNVDITKAKTTLESLSLTQSSITTLNISSDNKTTARDLTALITISLKNFPTISDITKNPNYELANGEKIDNNITFKESTVFRVIGMSYDEQSAVTFAYSGDTKLIVTTLNNGQNKENYFNNLQKTYDYLFSNYSYKLALKAGSYKINNEDITFDKDIYDLFYNKHSIKDVTYLLMNNKILLFQKYETVSANNGTVYVDFSSATTNGTFTKVKNTFLNDADFSKKNNSEKTTIVISRAKYFISGILAVYSIIFIIFYLIKKLARED